MILLDTNVVSEGIRAQPAESVVAWLNGQPSTRAAAVRGTLQRRSMAGICGPTTSRVISRSGGASTRWIPSAYA